jgi:hypothetical protein
MIFNFSIGVCYNISLGPLYTTPSTCHSSWWRLFIILYKKSLSEILSFTTKQILKKGGGNERQEVELIHYSRVEWLPRAEHFWLNLFSKPGFGNLSLGWELCLGVGKETGFMATCR